MPRPLRLRSTLLLYGALVAAASLLVLGAVLARGARLELDSRIVERPGGDPALDPWTRRLAAGGPQGWAPAVTDLHRAAGRPVLLVDPAGRVLVEAPSGQGAAVRPLPGGGYEVERRQGGESVLLVVRGDRGAVRDAGGRLLATVLLLPAPPRAREGPAALAGALLRWLLLAAAAALAVAVPLGALLARRTAAPIEALTAAARRLREGDLDQRVPAGGGVSETAELARAFNAMVEALGRAETARQRLVADVAHELRTPLTRMRASLEALEDGLRPLDRAAVRSLQEEVMLLSRLVADLQDLALADAGRLRLRLVDVDLEALVARVAAAHEAPARTAGVALRVAVEPGLALRGDPERIVQVLGNLLANALQWTPAGGAVELAARRRVEGVEITVADSGPGIDPQDLPRVFDRFYRADPSRARNGRGGVGIGLSVVAALAQAHGGGVTAANGARAGAVFTVRLPMVPSPVPDSALVASP